MAVIKGIRKNQTEVLKISQSAERRLVAGLSWNAVTPPKGKLEELAASKSGVARFFSALLGSGKSPFSSLAKDLFVLKKTLKHDDKPGRDADSDVFDLDFDCYIFDGDGKFRFCIGSGSDHYADDSRKVYHSGDSHGGLGGNDDEQIHVETRSIPDDYRHFFFVVNSDSRYSLEEFFNPRVRLADSVTNSSFIENDIAPSAHLNAHGYIFCHVFRDGAEWKCRNIDDYADSGAGVDWPTVLAGYLT